MATRTIAAAGKKIPVITFFSSAKAAIRVASGQMLFVLEEPVDKWAAQFAQAIEDVTAGKTSPKQLLTMDLVEMSNAASSSGTC